MLEAHSDCDPLVVIGCTINTQMLEVDLSFCNRFFLMESRTFLVGEVDVLCDESACDGLPILIGRECLLDLVVEPLGELWRVLGVLKTAVVGCEITLGIRVGAHDCALPRPEQDLEGRNPDFDGCLVRQKGNLGVGDAVKHPPTAFFT